MYQARKPKGLIWLLLLAVSWPLNALAGGNETTAIVVENVGFATPESVEYYADEDVYLVTNINGSPFDAAGNGFISKIKPDGTVINLKWIDGAKDGITLHSPKGAAIVDNLLFVADRNQVQIFELPSGTQKASVTIESSVFLNGITPAGDGSVYVTDSGYLEEFKASGTDGIYKVSANGDHQLIINDADMGHPNGVLVKGDELLVVSFGSGELYSVDSSGGINKLPTPPSGNLDGLIELHKGQYAMSSWGGSAIYVYHPDGSFSTLTEAVDAPADLGIDTKRQRLLIPLFKQDKVIIQPY